MTGPIRIQRRRTRGWRMPPGTRCVTRGTNWGNNFVVGAPDPITGKPMTDADAVLWFKRQTEMNPQATAAALQRSFNGWNLACWCRLCADHAAGKPFTVECDACPPCHADVIGKIANAANPPTEEPNP